MNRRGRPPYPDVLTPREWEVLELLAQRLTNQEIADRLGLSVDGAKYHVSEIISKLGVSDQPGTTPDGGAIAPAPPVVPPDATVFLVAGSMRDGEPEIQIPVLSFSQFAWSPDGLRLAYTTRRDPQAPSDIFVMDIAHPESPRYLTSGSSPSWSADGRIVFSR